MTAPAAVRTSDAHRARLPSLRELWRYRELLRSLAARDLKVKYQRSALGFVWTLLNPILTVGVLVVVFHYIVKIHVEQYWAFVLSGYFAWNFVMQMLNTSTYVVAEHGALRRSVAFPSEVLVFGAAAARLVEFAVELGLIIVALVLWRHHGLPASYLLLPVLIVIQLLLTIGLVMPIATLSVFYTDVQHALPIALMSLFYVSPVFYPASLVPAAVRDLYMLNPIADLLTLYHTVLYDGRFPSAALLGATAAVSLVLYLAGSAIFNRYQALFAEVV
ncbi:MAG TPA: ABC transporter permease [Gemmatimonadaceae bacterium]|nr:ABC transporter permease [Gemmatimonadaceae bacterium]